MPNKYFLKSFIRRISSPRHLYASAKLHITEKTKAYIHNPNRRTHKIDHWLKSLSPAQGTALYGVYEFGTKPFHAYMYYQYGMMWAPAHSVIHVLRWPGRIYLWHCLHHNFKHVRGYRKMYAPLRKFKIKAKIRTKNYLRRKIGTFRQPTP